jgi:transposase-like protein
MSVSRRRFTREFKLEAVQRLETGASVAEVARAFEVDPNGRVAQLERKVGRDSRCDFRPEQENSRQAFRKGIVPTSSSERVERAAHENERGDRNDAPAPVSEATSTVAFRPWPGPP